MEITLESLGFTKKQLQERVIETAVERLLTGVSYDEDGNTQSVDTKLYGKLQTLIKERIDETIRIFAEKNVLPKVTEYIETLILQKTNSWGEKEGKPFTFIEYLISRSENYMLEQVDSDGRSEAECRDGGKSWYGSKTNRITFLVNKNLHDNIETAMKNALVIANNSIATGITETVKTKLNEIIMALKVTVGTK